MRIYKGKIVCSEDESLNILEYEEVFYQFQKLSEQDFSGGKGGNSTVFKLFDPNEQDYYIVKFCKYNILNKNEKIRKRIYRFENEIKALEKAKKINSENIIEIFFSGEMKIGNGKYRYYVMERGEMDLTEYLKLDDISDQQKVLLCSQILHGVNELHQNLKVYHRDIKPDNIFFVGDTWKIGDLGLISSRNKDFELDEVGEKIGPYGWLSPEVTNKALCEGTPLENEFCCIIDEQSDVFQLGKLFWYIFQGNIPIGQIQKEDFKLNNQTIFLIIQLMLQYSKERRPTMEKVEIEFQKTYSHFGI